MYITSPPDSTRLELTLKVNSGDLTSVIRTFERYSYDVKSWVANDDNLDRFYTERLDMLIKYLNI